MDMEFSIQDEKIFVFEEVSRVTEVKIVKKYRQVINDLIITPNAKHNST